MTETKMMACYCRVSTDKDEQLQSLAKQEEYFSKFATENGYSLYKIYADEGISGKQVKKRIEFQKMIRDAKQGKFQVIAVKDISRFARNTVDFLENLRELKLRGIEIRFTNNSLGSEDPEFILSILAAVAQEESAKLSERVKFGKAINAKKGRVPNFVFGYDKVGTFELKINEQEAEVVRKMYDLFVNEGYGTLKIAEYLNKEGILTKKQKRANWYQKTVIDILRNQIYIGKVVNGKTRVIDFITETREIMKKDQHIVVDRPEFRIISDEDFYKTQAILEQRKKKFKLDNKRESTKYPLSGLIKCDECGYSFRRLTRQYSSGGKVYKRWCCSIRNAKGKGACANTTVIDEDVIISHIKAYFDELLLGKESFVNDVIRETNKYIAEITKDIRGDEKMLKNQLADLKDERRKYIQLYAKTIITEEELEEYLRPIDYQIEKVNIQLAQIINSEQISNSVEVEVRTYLKDIRKLTQINEWSNLELKQIIDGITVAHTGEITVKLKMSTKNALPMSVPLYNLNT